MTRTVRCGYRLAAALGAALLAPGAMAAGVPAAGFDALRFFAGRTHGEGVLKVIFSHPHAIHIDGEGLVGPDGTLTLVQRVDEEGKPPRTREWMLRRIGADRYAATLSDAAGPVRVETVAGTLRIRFRTTAGLDIAQRLSPRAGGRVVDNHLVVHRHGLRVAVLDETIRRYD